MAAYRSDAARVRWVPAYALMKNQNGRNRAGQKLLLNNRRTGSLCRAMAITSAWEAVAVNRGYTPEKGTIDEREAARMTLKAAALVAGLIAVLLPTGCGHSTQTGAPPAPGSPETVVAPPTVN